MISLQTLPNYIDKPLNIHGDVFMLHTLSDGDVIITDANLGYKANIATINDIGIKWYRFLLGTKPTGVIKFSEIIEII